MGITALASGALALGAPSAVGAAPRNGDTIPGSYIVTLAESGESPADAAAAHGRREGFAAKQVYESAIRGYAADMSSAAAARLARRADVVSVEPDRFVSIAAKPSRGPATPAPAQVVPLGLARIGAVRTGVVDVDVAVIDTGIAAHTDLTIVGGYNCLSASRGAYGDANGHGTHVAGTIGAKDNPTGVIGVAPGARLHAVRVLDVDGNGSWSSIICGIDWVTRNASTIDVANMSLGGGGVDSECGTPTAGALHAAVCRSVDAKVTYVVAAGNSRADAASYTPATYKEVIAVSALADFDGVAQPGAATEPATSSCWPTEYDETLAEFSNFGADVDFIAPGVCIRSTWLGGGYKEISGTSMAAPHVAGAAALVKAAKPSATPAEVRTALEDKATTWSGGDDRDGIAEPMLSAAGL